MPGERLVADTVHGVAAAASGGILVDIAAAIIAATTLAYVARLLGQPLLLAYIGAGLLVGPTGLGLIHGEEEIAELSELGLAFLMFIVGLEIDLKKLVSSGRIGALVGTIQVALCAAMTAGFVALLGFAGLPALYLGVATAFSSTLIVVKLLSDRSELDTVDGRLTLGILLMQDVLAIVVLALQPNLTNPSVLPIAISLISGLGLVAGALLISRYVLPGLFRYVAKSPEIVLVSAISWCLIVGYLGMLADFSIAMGALIAGVTLSAFPYSLDVVAKIRSLRDFFVILFFVALGMQLQVDSLPVVLAAVALSIFVIASRFVTILPVLHALGYGTRVGTLSSIALAQAGEFGLVIVTLGLSLGHVGRDVASIVALTVVITATVSTYMVFANHAIAQRVVALAKRLGVPERLKSGDAPGDGHPQHDVILLGFHRVASSLVYETRGCAKELDALVVDFSPEVYRELQEQGVPIVYGDIGNLDTLEHTGVEGARVVVSTVSDDFLRGTDNVTLLKQIRRLNPKARVILSAETLERAREMYEAGADYVILPRFETARAFREILEALKRGDLDDWRARALAELEDRREVLA
ncbi:MAG: cation:proton antiporter [Chloroflexota bacterium]|nr:cation:proton antiporter [Chloroflexota bacterium]